MPSILSYDKQNTINALIRLTNSILSFRESESTQPITIDVKYRRAYAHLEFNIVSNLSLEV